MALTQLKLNIAYGLCEIDLKILNCEYGLFHKIMILMPTNITFEADVIFGIIINI